MRTRLSVLRPLVSIVRIALDMSVDLDAMGKMKKVLILVSPRHIRLTCSHRQNLDSHWLHYPILRGRPDELYPTHH